MGKKEVIMSKVKSEEYVRYVPPRLYFRGRFKKKWVAFIKELNRLRDAGVITEYDYRMGYTDEYHAIEIEFEIDVKERKFMLDFDSIRNKAELHDLLEL